MVLKLLKSLYLHSPLISTCVGLRLGYVPTVLELLPPLLAVDTTGRYGVRLVVELELELDTTTLGRKGGGVATDAGTVGAAVGCVDGSSLMQRGRALLHCPLARQLSTRGPSMR